LSIPYHNGHDYNNTFRKMTRLGPENKKKEQLPSPETGALPSRSRLKQDSYMSLFTAIITPSLILRVGAFQ